MPYLQAVIKVFMRVHPSVASVYPRYVPKGGATLGGYYLPAGVWDLIPPPFCLNVCMDTDFYVLNGSE